MSILKVAALAAVVAAAMATSTAQAQDARRGTAVTAGGPVRVAPGRPMVIDREPVRPRGERRDRPDRGAEHYPHLRERLRNACFNDPNPPVPLCRRVFGEHG